MDATCSNNSSLRINKIIALKSLACFMKVGSFNVSNDELLHQPMIQHTFISRHVPKITHNFSASFAQLTSQQRTKVLKS